MTTDQLLQAVADDQEKTATFRKDNDVKQSKSLTYEDLKAALERGETVTHVPSGDRVQSVWGIMPTGLFGWYDANGPRVDSEAKYFRIGHVTAKTSSNGVEGALPPFRKADAGKPRPTLLPAKALQNIVEVLEFGAEKYGRDNWRNVDDPQRYLDAALRHLSAMQIEGLRTVDKESGLPHIDHAACCLLFLSEIFREDWDAEVARAKAKLTSTMTDKKQ